MKKVIIVVKEVANQTKLFFQVLEDAGRGMFISEAGQLTEALETTKLFPEATAAPLDLTTLEPTMEEAKRFAKRHNLEIVNEQEILTALTQE